MCECGEGRVGLCGSVSSMSTGNPPPFISRLWKGMYCPREEEV